MVHENILKVLTALCFTGASVFLFHRGVRLWTTISMESPRSLKDAQVTIGSDQASSLAITQILTIGEVRSGFGNKRGVPRQGSLAPSTKASIVLFPHLVSGDTLDGLEAFSHIWVIFLFSRNSNMDEVDKWQSRGKNLFKSKVRPPVLGGKKVGVFSTRSPHRPNPIGMTLARIESVDATKGVIAVSGIDLCDHTPVIDLKPFVPADQAAEPAFAQWVLAPKPYDVVFSDEADRGLSACGRGKSHHVDVESLREAIRDVLALDVRGVGQKRGAVEPDITHRAVVDGVAVTFSFHANHTVLVHHAAFA